MPYRGGTMDLAPAYLIAFAVGTLLGMLLLLRIAERRLVSDLVSGNQAARLFRVGQVVAVFMIVASVVRGSVTGEQIGRDALWAAAFGAVGVVLMLVTGHLGVRLMFQDQLPAEIKRGNTAAGLASGAHFIAAGYITSRAMGGNGLRDLSLSLVFFVLAQVTLVIFVSLFRALTTYDDAEQIRGENFAAAISYGGLALAIAIVVGRALDGDFTGWANSLKGYAGVLASGVALYPVRQLFVQSFLLAGPLSLRGGRIDSGIAAEHDAGIAALEGATYVATALALARLLG